jgi:DNA-binding response OmpR family regulator
MSSPATTLLLFVEDEVLIQDLVETILKDGGFDVETVLTGAEAFETLGLRAAEFAAVITDVNLPAGPDGWEVGRRARELVSDMPVIYVTGDSAHEWSSKGVPDSIILSKPFAPAQLVVAVASLLNAAHP